MRLVSTDSVETRRQPTRWALHHYRSICSLFQRQTLYFCVAARLMSFHSKNECTVNTRVPGSVYRTE